jgi:RecB family exonuclease
MLQVQFLKSPQDRSIFLKDFDPQATTWVVSDLKMKLEIQRHILQRQSFFEDTTILRASELWVKLAQRNYPHLKFVSHDWIQAWLRTRIHQLDDIKIGKKGPVILESAMNLFHPIFLNEIGSQKLKDWLQESPESLARWGGWYLLSERMSEELLKQHKIGQFWIQGLLQKIENLQAPWTQSLVFDLGLQISMLEAEIIKLLSSFLEVTVLIPFSAESQEFAYLYKPYDFLLGFSGGKYPAADETQFSQRVQKKIKVPSVLAETKWVVEKIRGWIAQGVEPSSILLAAPDIEIYWPLLQPVFKAEGIPCQKAKVTRLSTLPQSFQWISRLKIQARQVDYENLEISTYASMEEPPQFEEFSAMYSELFDEFDLSRNSEVEKYFNSEFSKTDLLTRDQFFLMSGRQMQQLKWSDSAEAGDPGIFKIAFRDVFANTSATEKLRLEDWIFLLQRVLEKKELTIDRPNPVGIQICNISSADSFKETHRIYIGLSDGQLKKTSRRTLLNGLEVQKIANDIGYYFEDPDIVPAEFDLCWQARQNCDFLFSYPETNFEGAADSASSFWLNPSIEEVKYQNPHTVWDSRLQSLSAQDFKKDSAEVIVESQLLKNLNLSVSELEKYRNCPYTLFAEKFLKQKNPPIFDMEVDPRSVGSILHGVLEFVINQETLEKVTEEQVTDQLEKLRIERETRFLDSSIWKSWQNRYLNQTMRFLEIEKEYRKEFPGFKMSYTEKSFVMAWSKENRRFEAVRDNGSQSIIIRGRIDRIDEDKIGNILLYDYKLARGQHTHWNQWISSNKMQLLVYCLAIVDGAIPEFLDKKVVGALYYILKDVSRNLGFKVAEVEQHLFSLDKKKNRIEESGVKELLDQTRAIVAEIVEGIQGGKFAPQPFNVKDCGKCHWRNQCRAPHLV